MDGHIGYDIIIFMAGSWVGFIICLFIKGSNGRPIYGDKDHG